MPLCAVVDTYSFRDVTREARLLNIITQWRKATVLHALDRVSGLHCVKTDLASDS